MERAARACRRPLAHRWPPAEGAAGRRIAAGALGRALKPMDALRPTGALSLARCYHCGEALPPAPAHYDIDGARQAFCCDGCAAAAQWIREADLGDYYRLRSEAASRVGT